MARRQEGVGDQRRLQRRESRAGNTWRNFLAELCADTGLDAESATDAAVSVLSHLEERLTGEEARDLEAQLPVKLRQLLAEAGGQMDTIHKLHRPQFLARVAVDLGISEDAADTLSRAVFTTVRRHISAGEARDVEAQLPGDLRPLWAHPG